MFLLTSTYKFRYQLCDFLNITDSNWAVAANKYHFVGYVQLIVTYLIPLNDCVTYACFLNFFTQYQSLK